MVSSVSVKVFIPCYRRLNAKRSCLDFRSRKNRSESNFFWPYGSVVLVEPAWRLLFVVMESNDGQFEAQKGSIHESHEEVISGVLIERVDKASAYEDR